MRESFKIPSFIIGVIFLISLFIYGVSEQKKAYREQMSCYASKIGTKYTVGDQTFTIVEYDYDEYNDYIFILSSGAKVKTYRVLSQSPCKYYSE